MTPGSSVDALFYLDPPYWGSEYHYGRDQFELLAERLSRLRGSFILSINDVPEIRPMFSRFRIEQVDLVYTVTKGRPTGARELIVCGP